MDGDLDSQDIKLKTWMHSTVTLICTTFSHDTEPFSIGVVPDELRKWNENAYIPKVVTIGPRYKGATRNLQQMEQIKWRCLKSLCNCLPDDIAEPATTLQKCMEGILEIEVEARASYAEKIKLDRYELAEILLNDGAFLLQLLFNEGLEEIDEVGMLGDIDAAELLRDVDAVGLGEGLTDLILLENQIPFVILKVLAVILIPTGFTSNPIELLVKSFLGRFSLHLAMEFNNGFYPSHFLELVYVSLFEKERYVPLSENERQHSETTIDVESRDVNVKLNRCATKLLAAGVTIIRGKTADVDVKLIPLTGFNFDISFNNGQLVIPRLRISERAGEGG